MLEEETVVLHVELQSTKQEVEQLRAELNKANGHLVARTLARKMQAVAIP